MLVTSSVDNAPVFVVCTYWSDTYMDTFADCTRPCICNRSVSMFRTPPWYADTSKHIDLLFAVKLTPYVQLNVSVYVLLMSVSTLLTTGTGGGCASGAGCTGGAVAGATDGAAAGCGVGAAAGCIDAGCGAGACAGCGVGACAGCGVGACVGCGVGACVGCIDGVCAGCSDGATAGCSEGATAGCMDGEGAGAGCAAGVVAAYFVLSGDGAAAGCLGVDGGGDGAAAGCMGVDGCGDGAVAGWLPSAGDNAAAINGLELVARTNGWLVQKHEIGGPGDFARLSDEELQGELIEVGKAIGISDKELLRITNGSDK